MAPMPSVFTRDVSDAASRGILVVLAIWLVLSADSPPQANFWLYAILFLLPIVTWVSGVRNYRASWFDLWLVGCLAYSVFAIQPSIYPRSSLLWAFRFAALTALYVCYLLIHDKRGVVHWVAVPCAVAGTIAIPLAFAQSGLLSTRAAHYINVMLFPLAPQLARPRSPRLLIILAVLLAAIVASNEPERRWRKRLYITAIVCVLIGIGASGSRALITATMALLANYVIMQRLTTKSRGACVVVTLVLVMAPLTLTWAGTPATRSLSAQRSDAGRIALWHEALYHWRERPFVGSGPGTFAILNAVRSQDTGRPYSGGAQNLWLQTLAEGGILGLIALCGWLPLRLRRNGISTGVRALSMGHQAVVHDAQGCRLENLRIATVWALALHESAHATLFSEWDTTVLLALLCVTHVPPQVPELPRVIGKHVIVLALALPLGTAGVYGVVAWREMQKVYGSFALSVGPLGNAAAAGLAGLREARAAGEVLSFRRLTTDRLDLSETSASQLAAAREYFAVAARLNPSDALWHHNLAWICLWLNDEASAIREHAKAQELDATNSIYALSGALIAERHRPEGIAVERFATAIALAPERASSDMIADLARRNPLIHSAALQLARRTLESRASTDLDPIVNARLGALYVQLRDWQSAAVVLRRTLQDLPKLPRAWANLSIAEMMLGRDGPSREALRHALRYGPADAKVLHLAHALGVSAGDPRYPTGPSGAFLRAPLQTVSEHYLPYRRMYQDMPSPSDDIVPNGMLVYASGRITVDVIATFRANVK